MSRLRGAVSAICQVITRECCGRDISESDSEHQELVEFVLSEHARMPDYLKLPFASMVWLFDKCAILYSGVSFQRQRYEARLRHVRRFRESRLGAFRDFVFFFETFVIFFWYTRNDE